MHAYLLMLCLVTKPTHCIVWHTLPRLDACLLNANYADYRYPTLYAYCQRVPRAKS